MTTGDPMVMCTGKRGFFLSSRGEKIALGSCGSHRCKGRLDELKWLGSVSIACLLDFTVQPQEVNSLPFHVLVYTVKIISFFLMVSKRNLSHCLCKAFQSSTSCISFLTQITSLALVGQLIFEISPRFAVHSITVATCII